MVFTGQDLTLDADFSTIMTVGASLGRGGQAAVFSVDLPEPLAGNWSRDDVVLRVSYQDDEYGRDPRRTAIYRHLARLRGTDPGNDPLEGLLRLHAVGHLPPGESLPGLDLWAQVLDRGGTGLQQWIGGNHRHGLGYENGVAVLLPMMRALSVCHREGIVHRDIKPGNVFVNPRMPVPAPAALAGRRAAELFAAGLPFLRLGDLGSMTYLSAEAMARLEAGDAPESVVDELDPDGSEAMTHMFTTNIQSGPFTPPEVWASAAQGEAHPAGDVWQLAVTLFYACTGELPFRGWHGAQWRTERSRYVEATRTGEPNVESFAQLPERLQYLLRWGLTPDPLDRPDLASLTDELADLPGVRAAILAAAQEPEQTTQVAVPVVTPVGATAASRASAAPSATGFDEDAVTVPSGRPAPAAEPVPDAEVAPSTDAPVESAAPAGTRRALVAVSVICVVLLVLGVAFLRQHRAARQPGAAPTPQLSTTASPLGSTGAVQWNLDGRTLGEVLPQLFTDTPLAKRPNLGTLTEKGYSFCRDCSGVGVRLRVDVSPPPGPTLTANGKSGQPLPIGPYLVLMMADARSLPYNPVAADENRVYTIAPRFASAKYRKVVLVPMNRIGEGGGGPGWQTEVSNSRSSQRLTFDIPGRVSYITVLWFNADGVVGFNQFPSASAGATGKTP